MACKLLMNYSKISYVPIRLINKTSLLHTTNDKRNVFQKKDVKYVRVYILDRFINYVKNYDKIIERRFPSALNAYRIFTCGVKEFYKDLKSYMKVVKIFNKGNTFKNLNRKEIELYYQMPRDIIKVLPILILGTMPFSNYVILPLILYFPRQLLTAHFWNLQQKKEFGIIYLQKRLNHQRPVFRHLQSKLYHIEDKKLQDKWANVLGVIGSGIQPNIEDILECKILFDRKPYHLKHLNANHTKQLAKLHGIPGFWLKSSRLNELGKIVYNMDMAIVREGGVHNLSQDSLRTACIIRGLNPTNMRNEDMIQWLKQWVQISEVTEQSNPSLLLHCPILLGYNQPSNWALIYSKRTK